MLKKRCYSCGIIKDSTEFFKDSALKDGLQTICKKCGSIRGKKHYREHKEQMAEQHKRYYENNKEQIACRVERYNREHREATKARCMKYRKDHKKQETARHRKYREDHQEQEKTRSRKYYVTHKEEIAGYRKKYHQEHRDDCRKYRNDHKEQLVCYDKQYRQTPVGKATSRRKSQNRRARTKNLEATLTAKQWEQILKIQKNQCNICGRTFTAKRPATQDHIIPVMHNGSYTFDNIQALCSHCNSSKNARLDPQFIQTWTHL